MAKATDPGTIVAYAMNGQPIPAPHGVPAPPGRARLGGRLRHQVAQQDHAGHRPSTTASGSPPAIATRPSGWRPAPPWTPKDMAPLTGLVVKSLITRPLDGAVVDARQGRPSPASPGPARIDIARVDVSTDAGATWQPAQLAGQAEKFAWRRFEFTFDGDQAGHAHRAVARHRRAMAARSRWCRSGIRRAICGTRRIRCASR